MKHYGAMTRPKPLNQLNGFGRCVYSGFFGLHRMIVRDLVTLSEARSA
jgi:hypothetical protein